MQRIPITKVIKPIDLLFAQMVPGPTCSSLPIKAMVQAYKKKEGLLGPVSVTAWDFCLQSFDVSVPILVKKFPMLRQVLCIFLI